VEREKPTKKETKKKSG